MSNGNVGAGILDVITESLYDKPIVVFREYVQNSVDSFRKSRNKVDINNYICEIWLDSDCLYFLDNGNGIKEEKFLDEMISIGHSHKSRSKDIGYKGIGRLSGLPYCGNLIFINVLSYRNNVFQKYYIDGTKHNQVKAEPTYHELEFYQLMEKIGTYTPKVSKKDLADIQSILAPYKEIFEEQDTGFLVILDNIGFILKQTIDAVRNNNILTELGWLLPVKFSNELLQSDQQQLFEDMLLPVNEVTPAEAYNIRFNGEIIERPIKSGMLRDYVCKSDLEYAVGFHSFYRDRIMSRERSDFSGIRLYLDNMLLCDETELIPMLQQYGYIKHTSNELIQTVRGIGAMIYITDKVNISANSRRTFIEVTDDDSLKFLKLIAEFVNKIYEARYALSRYNSGKNVVDQSNERLNTLRNEANLALQALATEKIEIEEDAPKAFADLDELDKKKTIKKVLTQNVNLKIKEYLAQTTVFDFHAAYANFIIWLTSNKN